VPPPPSPTAAATAASDSTAASSSAVKAQLLIQAKDLLELEASDISLEGRPQERDSFKTDTQVTGNAFDRREKQLQAWGQDSNAYTAGSLGGPGSRAASGGIQDGLEGMTLDSVGPAAAGKGQWDQFAANEKLYGLKSDYDDELYTTKLDRSGADYRQREAKAAQLEREILKVRQLASR
jgi:PAB1-binding protein PBP1